jgi:cysteine desulfurase
VQSLKENGRKIRFHTDAVQAVGKVRVDVNDIGCDLLSLSGHKIYAPKGIGALFVKRGTRLHHQNVGGRQERGLRGGTESVPLIVALGKAAELAEARLESDAARIKSLRDKFENAVFENISGSFPNGDREMRLPNISNISFTGVEGEGPSHQSRHAGSCGIYRLGLLIGIARAVSCDPRARPERSAGPRSDQV